MKKLKLTLNKETIAKLNDEEMKTLNGGEAPTTTCITSITMTHSMYCKTRGCQTNGCEPEPTGAIICTNYTQQVACWSNKCTQ